jgi:hypothetical protein
MQQMHVRMVQSAQQGHGPVGLPAAAQLVAAPQPQLLQHAGVLLQQQDPAAAAAAAAVCLQPQGWLTVLFPGLEEVQFTSAQDCAVALPCLRGHQTLHTLVIGVPQSGQQSSQRPQHGGVQCAQGGSSSGTCITDAAGCSTSGALGGQPAACGAGNARGVAAPWAVLRTLPCLENLEIHDAGMRGSWVRSAGSLMRVLCCLPQIC